MSLYYIRERLLQFFPFFFSRPTFPCTRSLALLYISYYYYILILFIYLFLYLAVGYENKKNKKN